MNLQHTTTTHCVGLLLSLLVGLTPGSAWAQSTPSVASAYRVRVVGGLAGVNQFLRNEEPFWTQELPRLTRGKYAADIVPFDRAGIPGEEMLRLMQMGVVPFGTVLMINAATQVPEFSAPDLAGLNPNIATLQRNVAAFRPYLQKTLHERYNIELLAIYTYPAQVLYCKNPFSSLADLAGRRIRVSGFTQSDFISALGGIPVATNFAQLLPNMASGNTECAITGTMSGNVLGLHEVTHFIHAMPITWGLAFFGANTTAWNALPGDLRTVLTQEIPKLETAIWKESEVQTDDGMACNLGAPTCASGRKGSMQEIRISPQDEKRRQDIFHKTVLPHWLQRCNNRCKAVWDQTIGALAPAPASR